MGSIPQHTALRVLNIDFPEGEREVKGAIRFRKSCIVFVASLALPSLASAQYLQTDLVSNTGTEQNADDLDVVNAWGLVSTMTSPFWVSDNGSGKSTLYSITNTPQGPKATKRGLVVTIPSERGGGQGTPTGIVANETANDFIVKAGGKSGKAAFIFARLDGTISAWNPNVPNTNNMADVIMADRSSVHATYTGLAVATSANGSFLYAADDGPNARVDMFDTTFALVKSLDDPGLPKNVTPYGIQTINGQLWVTFTLLNKAQNGFVDLFALEGTLIRRFALSGLLHSPWGVALAPPNFGPMSNAILITNNTPRGRMNAFDPNTGAFPGPLRDQNNQPIEIDDIWAIQFGQGGEAGSNGNPNQLFFTASPNNYGNDLFGVITFSQ